MGPGPHYKGGKKLLAKKCCKRLQSVGKIPTANGWKNVVCGTFHIQYWDASVGKPILLTYIAGPHMLPARQQLVAAGKNASNNNFAHTVPPNQVQVFAGLVAETHYGRDVTSERIVVVVAEYIAR